MIKRNYNAENIFGRLKKILTAYEDKLILVHNEQDNYYLNSPYSEKWKKEVFFGAVQVKKRYISFHLMPVYMYPELLEKLSPELKKRMQGKSCFNFSKYDEELFGELESLVKKSYERFEKEG